MPARLLLIGAEDLVSGDQLEPVRQKAHAHRHIEGEGDLLGGSADERAYEGARVDQWLVAGEGFPVRLEVRPVGKIVFELGETAGQRVDHLAWRGAEGARVAVRHAFKKRKCFSAAPNTAASVSSRAGLKGAWPPTADSCRRAKAPSGRAQPAAIPASAVRERNWRRSKGRLMRHGLRLAAMSLPERNPI
jgi:hypothetical protein